MVVVIIIIIDVGGTEYFRLFGDSKSLQFAGVLRLFSGVSGGTNIWSVTQMGLLLVSLLLLI